MEKMSSDFVVNGGLKLPIGYRFHPTDEELLLHYLKKKVLSIPLPASVIPEFDVFQAHPNDLPGNLREKRYFFYNQKRNANEEMGKRVSGYWKPIIGKEKQIVAFDNNNHRNRAFGVRKTLVFRERKRPRSERKTQWVMHEFHLLGSGSNPNSISQNSEMEIGEWVVFRIFQRKRRPRKFGGVVSQLPNNKRAKMTDMIIRPSYLDFTVENVSVSDPPTPCLSYSSGITEISSNGVVDDDQEENSNPTLFL